MMAKSRYVKAREEQQDPRGAPASPPARWLMCAAEGCPNRWSVSREGSSHLCSAHAWQPPALWPRITAEQVDWLEQHRLYGEARAAATAPVQQRTPKAQREQAPQSTSRAWRDMHGVDDDIEHDREGA